MKSQYKAASRETRYFKETARNQNHCRRVCIPVFFAHLSLLRSMFYLYGYDKTSHVTLPAVTTTLPKEPRKKKRLELVHITKTGGSAIEKAAAIAGINWGSCHFMKMPVLRCEAPDKRFVAKNLSEPWHRPPKFLEATENSNVNPYIDADLFAVVRNPYSRAVSEFYCPWSGIQIDKKGVWSKKDYVAATNTSLQNHNMTDLLVNPDVMNFWLQRYHEILLKSTHDMTHFVNQVEYVYDKDKVIIPNIVHYENISTEFHALMKEYNLNISLASKEEKKEAIYRTEVQNRLTYKDLDAATIKMINEYSKLDFQKFGYQMVKGNFPKDYSLNTNITLLARY
mmetsp:Transcript_59134/g.66150  ORF Transcript_59134/g.66150 Transcript_59134/m.66150 type:complete len:339 (+) Transcript_59134:20-1036(+)